MSPHPMRYGDGSRRGSMPGTLEDTGCLWMRRCKLVRSILLSLAGRSQMSIGLRCTIDWCSEGSCGRRYSGSPSNRRGASCSPWSTAQKQGIGWWRSCASNIWIHTSISGQPRHIHRRTTIDCPGVHNRRHVHGGSKMPITRHQDGGDGLSDPTTLAPEI